MTEHAIEIDRYGGPEELVWRAVRAPRARARRGSHPHALRRGQPRRHRDPARRVADRARRPVPVHPGARGGRRRRQRRRPRDRDLAGRPRDHDDAAPRRGLGRAAGRLRRVRRRGPRHLARFAPRSTPSRFRARARRRDRRGGARAAGAGVAREIVIHGASGGVGSAAVALASARGAEVIAVLPRRGKEDYVRSLGAARVVRLDEAGLLDALGPRSVDAVLETTGARTFADSAALLRRGGRLCLVGALTGPELAAFGLGSHAGARADRLELGEPHRRRAAPARRADRRARARRAPGHAGDHRFALADAAAPTSRSRPASSPAARCCASRVTRTGASSDKTSRSA